MTRIFSLKISFHITTLWKGGRVLSEREVRALQNNPRQAIHKLKELGYERYR